MRAMNALLIATRCASGLATTTDISEVLLAIRIPSQRIRNGHGQRQELLRLHCDASAFFCSLQAAGWALERHLSSLSHLELSRSGSIYAWSTRTSSARSSRKGALPPSPSLHPSGHIPRPPPCDLSRCTPRSCTPRCEDAPAVPRGGRGCAMWMARDGRGARAGAGLGHEYSSDVEAEIVRPTTPRLQFASGWFAGSVRTRVLDADRSRIDLYRCSRGGLV
ncbi:hypothetical protein OH77DRAFT_1001775 [Trametes cingulata]|nr:hypothetical protein OH77DRAFT_1001775 [Trametes cingulata]